MSTPYPGNSNWPSNWQGCTVTGTYVGLDGTPMVGTIVFSARPAVLFDYSQFKVIVPRGLQVPLDANGHFSIVLPATDDPDISPLDWTYLVTEQIPNGRSYDIEAPQNQTVDITQAAPQADATGTPVVRGTPGTGVVDLILLGSQLVVTLSDGTTVTAGSIDIDGGDPTGSGSGVVDGGTP